MSPPEHRPPDREWLAALPRVERVDGELLARLDGLLATGTDRELANDAVRAAGKLAARSVAVAARIARRARFERGQRERTVHSEVLAHAVAASGRAELAATAYLELEAASYHVFWAKALIACAGAAGLRHLLARMPSRSWSSEIAAAIAEAGPPAAELRDVLLEHPDPEVRVQVAWLDHGALAAVFASIERAGAWHSLSGDREGALWRLNVDPKTPNPDWNALARAHGFGSQLLPPPTPIEALTAPFADLRRRALDNLTWEPRYEHLAALLLAAALDRHLCRTRSQRRWAAPEVGTWGALLMALRQGTGPVSPPPIKTSPIGELVGRRLLEHLLDGNILPPPAGQRSTPDLDELRRLGVAHFAERIPAPAEFSAAERAALEDAETALIATC